jgi:hypothetical protein
MYSIFFQNGCSVIPLLTKYLSHIDIDECSEGLDDCQRDKHFCLNTEGNYTCQPQHDSKCPAGYKYNKAAATCEGNVLALVSIFAYFPSLGKDAVS